MFELLQIHSSYADENRATIFNGDCRDFLRSLPDKSVQLVITSPPYNIGKEYEKKIGLDDYVQFQAEVIELCHQKLKPEGSICWEVGNYVENSSIIPLDILLYPIFDKLKMKLRNRIVWHFRHGLHASKRLSGRYEMILWFTKSEDYVFNLDDVRVPQKYPGKKHFKGKKRGEYSSNPLGMNPSDVWESYESEKAGDFWDIPNVKANHKEKTEHPAQFPLALVDRLVKALSNPDDLVFDPFLGVGTTTASGILNGRRVAGAEIIKDYYQTAVSRTKAAYDGTISRREDKPVYIPPNNKGLTKNPYTQSRIKFNADR